MSVLTRVLAGGDPYEGRAARRRRLRLRVEGLVALSLSIVACGVAAALWIAMLVPSVTRFLG